MYNISSSYMMYLTVLHYAADHHSAFCVLQNTPAGSILDIICSHIFTEVCPGKNEIYIVSFE